MADELAGEVSSLMDEKQPVKPGDSKESNKVCFFYARNKRCKFGDKCRFVHADKKTKILGTTSGESPESVAESSGLSMNEILENPTSASSELMISAQENIDDTNEGIVKKPSSSEDLDSNQTKSHNNHQIAATERTTARHISKDSKEPKRTSKPRCRFFLTKAGCARGDACKFSHEKPKNQKKQKKAPKEQNKKANEGDDKEETNKDTVTKLKANEKQSNRTITRVVPTSTRLSMLDDNEVKHLRTRELNQLERGFGKLGLKTVNENNQTTYYINFTPSDPDWPFDIEVILLAVIFPEDYPKVMFKAFLSEEQDLPLELIRFTNKGISRWSELQQAARSTKDTVDLPFRPFLRWLDRNIEELFIEAAREMKKKETAMDANEEESLDMNESYQEEDSSERKEMTKHEKEKGESDSENMDPNKDKEHHRSRTVKKTEQKQKRKDDSYSYTSSERKELLLSDFLTFKKPNKNKGNKEAVSSKGSHGDRTQTKDSPKDHIVFVDQDLSLKKAENQMPEYAQNDLKVDGEDTNFESYEGYQIHDMPKGEPLSQGSQGVGNDRHRGTEMRFKGLELSENTSTLTTNFVTLMMECLKCKTKTEIKVEKARSSAVRCDKCSNILRITFRPAIIHQYSSTLGYLDLEGWHPFDLIMTEMQLTAGCLACSSETSIKGPHYGTNQVWCGKCHQKLAFKVESTRFFELTPTGVQDKNDVLLEKPKKKPKTPGLKEGFPLPDNGTCKHYKKSYRWLRFPCCGKCYPCDICHEEHEDHEIKFANRMVCGFCSKEQPYSQNPCVACNSSTTKAKTSHWEGGRGCRNKTLMSKGDDKKFKNTMKTTSRKAQAKETPKAKPK